MTDLSPELREKASKDAEELYKSFCAKLRKACDEILGDFEVNCVTYLESDAWSNYREAIRIEMAHEYKYSDFKNDWAKDLRRAIFVENREELAQLLSKDMLERIKYLEDCKQEYDQFRYSPGGDRYIDKCREVDQLKEEIANLKANRSGNNE